MIALRHIAFQCVIYALFFINKLEFQKSRLSNKILGTFCILDAGKLYDYAVISLGNDFRFRNTKLIDPVPDGLKTLFDDHFLDLFSSFVLDLKGNNFSATPNF